MSLPRINFLHLVVSKVKSRSDNVPAEYQLPTPYCFKIKLGQDFTGQGHYGKVKGEIKVQHDAVHLQSSTNVPTKNELPTHYSFRDTAWTRFYRSRSLLQGQRSNQGHIITLHIYNPQPMSLRIINFLQLTVSRI